jgi:hypothetical protein
MNVLISKSNSKRLRSARSARMAMGTVISFTRLLQWGHLFPLENLLGDRLLIKNTAPGFPMRSYGPGIEVVGGQPGGHP